MRIGFIGGPARRDAARAVFLVALVFGCGGQELEGEAGLAGPHAAWVEIEGVAHALPCVFTDGWAVAEGDVLLGSARASQGEAPGPSAQTAAVPSRLGLLWPGGIVPYVVDGNVPRALRADIERALAHWHERTAIRLVRRVQEDDYVRIRRKRGVCQAHLGRQGGEQVIELDEGCGTIAIIHEIGHAIGLYHEQSRFDRDLYITIHRANIERGQLYNFPKYRVGQDIGPYDYGSVMHYDSFAFSKNGEPTITRKDGGLIRANRTGLSAHDVAGVARLYRSR